MSSLALPRSFSVPWNRPSANTQFCVQPRPSRIRVAAVVHCSPRSKFSLFGEEEEPEENYPNKYHEPIALVTGASRGMGLEFTRQLLIKYPGQVVYGTARNPDLSEGLQALKRRHPVRCEIGTLDVTKEETVEALAKEIDAKYGRLDLIVNCAGILHIPNELQPELTLSELDADRLARVFEVNALGPLIVAKHFWELLKIGHGTSTGRGGAVIASMSHKCASMEHNTYGGWYGYRASKSCLNMVTKTLVNEAKRDAAPIFFVLLHPGTVRTQLSAPFGTNVPSSKYFGVEYAVERLLSIINKIRLEENGKFTSWDRQEQPW